MRIQLKKILVPTDFSEEAEHALRYAATFAEKFGAQIHLLHIIQDIVPTLPEPGLAILPTEEILASLQKGAQEGLDQIQKFDWMKGLQTVVKTLHGVPFHEICR